MAVGFGIYGRDKVGKNQDWAKDLLITHANAAELQRVELLHCFGMLGGNVPVTQMLANNRSARPPPQPETPQGKPLKQFREILHLTPEHFTHCMSWLHSALSSHRSLSILVLQGPASPARTALAHILRSLIEATPQKMRPYASNRPDKDSARAKNPQRRRPPEMAKLKFAFICVYSRLYSAV
ncbi:MAG: hypothetical protein M3Y27_22925 [Acidobacteriota bacterium]|nr:hypothetical protein [Acidobacteriota bacterium]